MLLTRLTFFLNAIIAATSLGVLGLVFNRQDELVLSSSMPTSAEPNWSWESCGSSHDLIKIESITIADELAPGEKATITLKFTAQKTVESGAYAYVTVKAGQVQIMKKEFDICEQAQNHGVAIKCPIAPGAHTIRHTVELPKEVPPVPFDVNIAGYSVDIEDLTCLSLKADFRKHK
ncbi:Phosphatidylglycerol/phosphatidylinositol transfer protein [Rhizoctonia solani]|uniref:Phosphatidylglycerol/phosphatidylinositol transfer protein n=1 Tax=Rhizoctonia solani TaxID=456999 RepID=A0A0K6FQ29_9AGAM|nr:Phosphatidylglycerol/phosphatidylinositol transfer protein [Rhizoctonia solani]